MFRRKKKIEQDYSYYYDDYYDDDEYYDDDDYYYDDEDEDDDKTEDSKEEPAASPKKSVTPAASVETSSTTSSDEKLLRELKEKEQEILTLRQAKADLDVQFASLQALPKHYQKLEEEQGRMNDKVSALESEKALLTARVQSAEKTSEQFATDVAAKQAEIDSLSTKLLNSGGGDVAEVEAVNIDLLKELDATKKELEVARARMVKLQESTPDFSKEDIAEVMLEAQAKARKIIDRANYDSKRIVIEAEKDLANIGQDARNYYERIRTVKIDSEEIFDKLLMKLQSIVELDRRNEN